VASLTPERAMVSSQLFGPRNGRLASVRIPFAFAISLVAMVTVLSSASAQGSQSSGVSLADLGITEPIVLNAENSSASMSIDLREVFSAEAPTLRLHFAARYADGSPVNGDFKSGLAASVDGQTAVQILLGNTPEGVSANGIGWVEGSRTTTRNGPDGVEMTYENYLQAADDPNSASSEFSLLLEASENTPLIHVEVFSDSRFLSDVPPGSSTTLEIVNSSFDDHGVVELDYEFVTDRVEQFALSLRSEPGIPVTLVEPHDIIQVRDTVTRGTIRLRVDEIESHDDGEIAIIADTFGFNSPAVVTGITISRSEGSQWPASAFILGVSLLVIAIAASVRREGKSVGQTDVVDHS